MGKTALMLNMAEYAAKMFGPVLIFSLEMGLGELGDRSLCGEARVDTTEYRDAARVRHRRAEFEAAARRLEGLPVFIDDTPAVTPEQVAAIARRSRRKHDLRMVMVDYLQIMGAENPRDSEYDRVGRAATALKNLSKQVGAPVIALSQLSRKCEERPDKRPIMSDLRATGQIEQDADLILFLHRAEKYNPGEAPGEAEIIVAKNRHGATGTATVAFKASLTRFENLIPDFGPAPDF
jgi:replicative DNA helicase